MTESLEWIYRVFPHRATIWYTLPLMTLFYKTCAAYKILLAFQMFKKTIFCDEKLKKRETQRKTFFLECSQLYSRDLQPPAAPKAYMAFWFISSWNCRKFSATENNTMELGRVGLDKGCRNWWRIGHRIVLENHRMEQAFSQTALLLYCAHPSLLSSAEIHFLAGKQRKKASVLLLLLQIKGWF